MKIEVTLDLRKKGGLRALLDEMEWLLRNSSARLPRGVYSVTITKSAHPPPPKEPEP